VASGDGDGSGSFGGGEKTGDLRFRTAGKQLTHVHSEFTGNLNSIQCSTASVSARGGACAGRRCIQEVLPVAEAVALVWTRGYGE
jgi:hypothetical protein